MASVRNGKMFALFITLTLLLVVAVLNFNMWPIAVSMFNDPNVSSFMCWMLSSVIVGVDVAAFFGIPKVAGQARIWYRQFYRV